MTYRDVQPKQPPISHQIPIRQWKKVTVALCRYNNKDYLIIVDSYSNYPDLYQIPNQTSKAIITAMQHSFNQFRVTEEIFSDNGLCFASAEYIQFALAWDFRRTSSLLYPQSNGLVEKNTKKNKKTYEEGAKTCH